MVANRPQVAREQYFEGTTGEARSSNDRSVGGPKDGRSGAEKVAVAKELVGRLVGVS